MNFYPFNVGDYAAHTGHLEPMEDLAYRRLLDQYYMRDGPLPADIDAAAKLVRMRSMRGDVESVLREFFVLCEDGWRHGRCDAEIAKMQDKQAKARASAKASVSARRANAERTLPEKSANAERTLQKTATDVELPIPIPREEKIPTTSDASASPPDERDLIWSTGVRLITASGKSESQARSFLGGQVKSRGSPAVAEAVTQALINKPVEPVSYIAEVASGNRKQRPVEDRSAAGRVRANVEKARAERENIRAVAVDGQSVWPSVDIGIRR